jgi:hypothetical protein
MGLVEGPGTSVNSGGRTAKFVLGTLAVAAAAALFLSGCSELGFPSVHDMPTPRADTTLTPDQVRQATDDLVNEREHLSTEAQAAGQTNPANGQQQKTAAQPAVLRQPVTTPAPAADPTQTAGAYARP